MADFIIADLYADAFGHEMPKEKFSVPKAAARQTVSSLGQKYYEEDKWFREYFMPVYLNGYALPFPVISLSRKKTIVSTALLERKGTVKELISADDIVIGIKGIIVRPDNKFPEQEIKELNDLFEVDKSAEMRSAFTDIFLKGDDKVVMKSFVPSFITGCEHAMAYTMDFESDLVYTLEV